MSGKQSAQPKRGVRAPRAIGRAGNGPGGAGVADIQRARMLGAMVQEISKRGASSVSVAHVVERSGVSRRTFYEAFEDREHCFLEALDEALKGVAAEVVPAYESSGSWRAKIRRGLTAALECLEGDRDVARLLIVESLAAGPLALQRRQDVLARIVSVVDEGRVHGKSDVAPRPLMAEGIVGGVLSVLHARLVEADSRSLLELVGPLMGMIVMPYLGAGVARKEIEQPVPKQASKHQPMRWDPLQGLEIRLTYRTVRVLSAVAQTPESSNRSIGEVAGIGDQGQVSKLLMRLRRLGLIENKGMGAASRGEPNSWTLTEQGRAVHAVISSV